MYANSCQFTCQSKYQTIPNFFPLKKKKNHLLVHDFFGKNSFYDENFFPFFFFFAIYILCKGGTREVKTHHMKTSQGDNQDSLFIRLGLIQTDNQMPKIEGSILSEETEEQGSFWKPGSNPRTTRVQIEQGSDKRQMKVGGSFQEKHPSPLRSMFSTNPSYRIKCRMAPEQCIHSLLSLLYHHQ